MKKKRFSEEQIIAVLKEAEAGAKVLDLCRKHGISDATFYNWKAKYAGMTVADLRRLKELEAENAKLKRIVADQALDNAALKDLLSRSAHKSRHSECRRFLCFAFRNRLPRHCGAPTLSPAPSRSSMFGRCIMRNAAQALQRGGQQ